MDGVIAAVPTPVGKDLSPMQEPFLEHCRWALDNGCDGLNILGSTGEANSFDTATRKQIMGWAAEGLPQDKLMVGTGTPSLRETIDLTVHADELGYSVALVLPPYYYKPVDPAGLKSWYIALHDALGARKIQIYFYNFPQMTGLTIPVDLIADLASLAPDRFAGIKDSSGDLDYCRAIVAAAPALQVFPSSETALQSAATDGFAGCISASVNTTAPLAAQVWSERSAPPQEICNEIARQRGLLAGSRLVPIVKFLAAARSGNEDWRTVLPPFTALTGVEGKVLQQDLGQTV
ncbi:dihydrodipicolinate synthase family protein [Labrenzia sp. PHM005]|uniref:dihydrodipicolinate synthase family protein n=1 Tax=Labrenzia sp. PHM005 TaxID=2590016 RepID=UPI00114055FA|nr:dihydrodipicolinate synthase family protein [Labrenzia sp. PHM005]QDG77248.1 dihydrodipicolinate synthase family protein [Labrenzia sp. PHM005]